MVANTTYHTNTWFKVSSTGILWRCYGHCLIFSRSSVRICCVLLERTLRERAETHWSGCDATTTSHARSRVDGWGLNRNHCRNMNFVFLMHYHVFTVFYSVSLLYFYVYYYFKTIHLQLDWYNFEGTIIIMIFGHFKNVYIYNITSYIEN